MAGKSRFDIPLASSEVAPRTRRSGPMGAAGREVGESLAAATEAQVEARRRNAADARAFRAAQEGGLVLSRVPLDDIRVDDLPRDRMALDDVATSDEMDELKASIRARGQREPIEVYRDAEGRLQLKKGWRRLTALRLLHAETGEARFAEAVCRIDGSAAARVELFIDMVEENAVREDLSFAEMAQLAIAATRDPACGFASYDDAIRRLYDSLH
jgi:ParB family chromosome partitioning protein